MLVGISINSIEYIYIKWGIQYSWTFSSALQACDILFKLFMIFNLKYPKDCEWIWILLQHRVYYITTQWDKKIGEIINLENSLQQIEKKKQQ